MYAGVWEKMSKVCMMYGMMYGNLKSEIYVDWTVFYGIHRAVFNCVVVSVVMTCTFLL